VGARGVWGEIPLLREVGERKVDATLGVSFGFSYDIGASDLTSTQPLRLGLNVVSADASLVDLKSDLPGAPRLNTSTLQMSISQQLDWGSEGNPWQVGTQKTYLAFDLDFTDPSGATGTAA
jgi:hypothetical protein